MTIGFRSGSTKQSSWIVAYDPDTLTQLGSVEFKVHAGHCLLNNLFVTPDFRERGLATQLIQATLEEVKLPYKQLRWGIRPDVDSIVVLKRAFDRKFREVP